MACIAAMDATEQPPTPDQTRSLLRHLEVAARLVSEPERVLSIARANLQRWGGTKRHDQERLLEQPPARIALLLTESSQDAADLRQGTPFAGVLTPAMRRAAIELSRELGIGAATMRGADARAHVFTSERPEASPRRSMD